MMKENDCKSVTELISFSNEEKLAFFQHCAINIHLIVCPYCRAFKKNNKAMRKLMQEFKQRDE